MQGARRIMTTSRQVGCDGPYTQIKRSLRVTMNMNESVIQRAVEGNDPVLATVAIREIDARLSSSLDQNERGYLLFSRASCCGILGDFVEARRHLAMALHEGRTDPNTKLAFDFNSGLLSQREGKYTEALETLSATLSNHSQQLRRPDLHFMYEDIQQRRAFLSVTLSRFQDAVPLLQESLLFKLSDELRSSALASLGLCYLELKDYELAKHYLLEAVTLGLTTEWKGTAHFYLGMAYFYTDLVAEAKREFILCEQLSMVHDLPTVDIYGWLSVVM
jgi:tetratricopeptide (TPR) repeat protein